MINWWAITTISFWICGAISSIFTKDAGCLFFSLIASMLLSSLFIMK